MGSIDLRKACLNSLSQIADDLQNALVYMDAGSGEALHFIGGLSALLPFSPRAVCSLENASPLDGASEWNKDLKMPVEKVLVITSCLLSEAHRYILRCLHTHTAIKKFTVLTSISEEAHSAHPDTPLGTDAFHDYKKLLLEHFHSIMQTEESDLLTNLEDANISGGKHNETDPDVKEEKSGSENLEPELDKGAAVETEGLMIEIKHFPMLICPLSAKAFVFPSGGTLAGALLSGKTEKGVGFGLPCIDKGVLVDDDENIPVGGMLLAHFLQHLAGQLDVKLDVFTLGPLAHDVGKLLTELAGLADVSVRSKRSAGLLLIDRTLDLITPSCHGDSFIDRFFAFLPRRECENDVRKLTYKSNSLVLKRRPLDIRVSNTNLSHGEDVDEFGFLNQDSFSNLTNHSNQTGLQALASQNNVDSGKEEDESNRRPLDRTVSLLSMMGGSLFDSVKGHEKGYLDLLFEKRISEAALSIKKWLHEALRQEKKHVSTRRLGAASAEDIHALRKQLFQSFGATVRHAELIQIANAAELAIGSVMGTRWEALSSAEKVLTICAGDSQSVAFQIRDLVNQSIHRGDNRPPSHHSLLSLRDALTLAIVGYALAGDYFGTSGSGGPFSWEEERELKQTVIDAILQGSCDMKLGFLCGLEDSLAAHLQHKESSNPSTESFLHSDVKAENNVQDAEVSFDDGWETWDDEPVHDGFHAGEIGDGGKGYGEMQLQLEVRDRVEEVFKRLHKVSETRRHIKVKEKTLSLEEGEFGGSSRSHRSLIYKVLSMVFAKADIPGLKHHSSAIGRFIKSGLGRFGLVQAKSKLSDSKVLLVFVIGGINGVEVCEAKEAQAAYAAANGFDVLLGGTSFLAPDDIYELVIGSIGAP